MFRYLVLMAIVLFIAVGSAAEAQDVWMEKNISLALANEAAGAAVAACKEKGWLVSAAVVDRAGLLVALQRADGAGPHTLDSSRRKAYTAVSMKSNTTALMELTQKNPNALNLSRIDGLLLLGGGMPIRAGEEIIGGIGVGGAPGGQFDDQCAEAGITKIRDRLK